jgi:hypothetical protein
MNLGVVMTRAPVLCCYERVSSVAATSVADTGKSGTAREGVISRKLVAEFLGTL